MAFVNSERWLAKSRVDITLRQHGKFPATFLLKFFVLYYKRNIKHFCRIDIQLYQHSLKLEKLEIVVFPISTRVDITVYQHGKCFIFVKYKCWNRLPTQKRHRLVTRFLFYQLTVKTLPFSRQLRLKNGNFFARNTNMYKIWKLRRAIFTTFRHQTLHFY